jgi:hypothetical protein
MLEKGTNLLDVLPLPFDNEIKESKGDVDDLIEQYNRLKESGVLDG